MGMQVSNINSAYGVYTSEKVSVVKKTKNAKVADKDSFNLSNEAKDFNTIRAAIAKSPDIRLDKVNRIKEQIETGTYNVSSEDIANKLVDSYFA